MKRIIKKMLEKRREKPITTLRKLKKKNILRGSNPIIKNSKIIIKGKNNILYCEEGVRIINSKISFNANNSLIYLSKSKYDYKINISINNNSVCYFGINNYINQNVTMVLSEEKNIFIGNDCMFSTNIFFRVADPHLIFDINSSRRINLSKSIYIGDHIWIGQNALILKGSKIGSGCILAANALLSNKHLSYNCIYGSNPSKLIKKNIFWDGRCVNKWTAKETIANMECNDENAIFQKDKYNINFDVIEKDLNSILSATEKLSYIQKIPQNKNRFYLDDKSC